MPKNPRPTYIIATKSGRHEIKGAKSDEGWTFAAFADHVRQPNFDLFVSDETLTDLVTTGRYASADIALDEMQAIQAEMYEQYLRSQDL